MLVIRHIFNSALKKNSFLEKMAFPVNEDVKFVDIYFAKTESIFRKNGKRMLM